MLLLPCSGQACCSLGSNTVGLSNPRFVSLARLERGPCHRPAHLAFNLHMHARGYNIIKNCLQGNRQLKRSRRRHHSPPSFPSLQIQVPSFHPPPHFASFLHSLFVNKAPVAFFFFFFFFFLHRIVIATDLCHEDPPSLIIPSALPFSRPFPSAQPSSPFLPAGNAQSSPSKPSRSPINFSIHVSRANAPSTAAPPASSGHVPGRARSTRSIRQPQSPTHGVPIPSASVPSPSPSPSAHA